MAADEQGECPGCHLEGVPGTPCPDPGCRLEGRVFGPRGARNVGAAADLVRRAVQAARDTARERPILVSPPAPEASPPAAVPRSVGPVRLAWIAVAVTVAALAATGVVLAVRGGAPGPGPVAVPSPAPVSAAAVPGPAPVPAPVPAPAPAPVREPAPPPAAPPPAGEVLEAEDPVPGSGDIDREAIKKVIRARTAQVRACYESALRKQPDLEGSVRVGWGIRPDGRVEDARIEGGTLSSPDLASCLLARVASWRFPAVRAAAPIRVVYPFVFRTVR